MHSLQEVVVTVVTVIIVVIIFFPGDVHQGAGQAARLVWRGSGSVSRFHEPPIVIKMLSLSS